MGFLQVNPKRGNPQQKDEPIWSKAVGSFRLRLSDGLASDARALSCRKMCASTRPQETIGAHPRVSVGNRSPNSFGIPSVLLPELEGDVSSSHCPGAQKRNVPKATRLLFFVRVHLSRIAWLRLDNGCQKDNYHEVANFDIFPFSKNGTHRNKGVLHVGLSS